MQGGVGEAAAFIMGHFSHDQLGLESLPGCLQGVTFQKLLF